MQENNNKIAYIKEDKFFSLEIPNKISGLLAKRIATWKSIAKAHFVAKNK